MTRFGTVMAICGLMMTLNIPAHAQTEAPKIELAGTYAYMRTNIESPGGYTEGLQTNGGTGSVAINLNRMVGIVGEVGGYNTSTVSSSGKQDITFASYLFGPRVSIRKWDTLTPYVQALFGGVKGNNALRSGAIQSNQNAFAWTAGGGLDARLTDHIFIRVFQAEFMMTKWNDGVNNRQNNFRLETGLVLHFGKR